MNIAIGVIMTNKFIQLSAEAIQLCEKNYGKVGSGCGKCPINSECTRGTNGWSIDALNDHTEKVNFATGRLKDD